MLILSHNGAEWHGTFIGAFRELVKDLLLDGPFEARLTFESPALGHTVVTDVTVTSLFTDLLHVTTVTAELAIRVDDVLAIEVA